ncbi:hypothetical protein ABBQ32_011219 [Trebouxia sp. C0010 RCD-2024]
MKQLVRTLNSRQTGMEKILLFEVKASLADGVNKLKKNEQVLQLRKDSMLPRITSKMAALKTEICPIFASLGQECEQDGKEQTDHIREQWGKRISSIPVAKLSNSLGRVQCVHKTIAYRTTFKSVGLLASMDDVLGAVEEQAASCLTAFANQHVFTEIVTNIGVKTRT